MAGERGTEPGPAGRGEVRIAVLASGQGSNFRRLAAASRDGELAGGRVALLVSDQPSCGAVAHARALGLPVFARRHKASGGRDGWENAVLAELAAHRIDLIVLAGYMRIVGPALLAAYGGRTVNVHPSLLPHFPGLHAVRQALLAGVPETGVTVHYIDEGIDTGPVIAQARVPVLPGDTEEALLERVHAAEHALLPVVVRDICGKCAAGPWGKGMRQ